MFSSDASGWDGYRGGATIQVEWAGAIREGTDHQVGGRLSKGGGEPIFSATVFRLRVKRGGLRGCPWESEHLK